MGNQESPYKKLLIWYFSGTGNARYAAMQIAKNAEEKGMEVHVYNMADRDPDFSEINDRCLIGFCYPTHGFNAPPLVLKFISQFPKGKSKAFVLNTRAGLKLYNIHFPGIGGLALWLPALILKIKGFCPIGFRPLDLPSNWISLHPGLNKKAIDYIVQRCTCTLSKFSDKILEGKAVLNGFLWIPLDIVLIPISFLYYFFGRFAIAKTFFASTKCNNCGLCLKQCSVEAIKEVQGRMYWTFNCESCMQCMNNCPKRAIETAHGFSFFIWWLAMSAIPYLSVRALLHFEVISADFYKEYAELITNGSALIFGFIIIFSAYKLLHHLLGIKIINKMISYSSLTSYKFWNRYKNTY